jgi:hypothetical protein
MGLAGSAQPDPSTSPKLSFAPELLNVENLAVFRPVARTGFFSSYDRTGGNDDGFSGKYSFLRKEGDGLVLADVSGRGAISRIYVEDPTLLDIPIEFYFDGEAKPRMILPLRGLFDGKHHPFVSGLSGHGLGGYWSYVPLEFARSIKIVARTASFKFYEISYVIYEPGVAARTFTPSESFAMPSIPHDGTSLNGRHLLQPGQKVTILDRNGSGRIQSLKLGPSSAFAGKRRDIVLRMYWEGADRPAVDVPVGDFFGYSFGRPATRSLLLGTEGDWNYAHFPMPFERAARIELLSERAEPVEVQSEIVVSDHGKAAQEGSFHAEWRRENPTTPGRPFTYLDVSGHGHLVAAILQTQGREPGETGYFEGDEEAIIDGQVAFHGTGSETSFNGGWYDIAGRWDARQSFPWSGSLDYIKSLSRTGGYRLFLTDPYIFHRSLRYTIEHGPEGNKEVTDYVGTTFYYLDNPGGSSSPLPPVAERAVRDPEVFLLNFYPSPPPIVALLDASLEQNVTRSLGGKSESTFYASFKRTTFTGIGDVPPEFSLFVVGTDKDSNRFDEGMFGPPSLVLSVEVPVAGTYAIDVEGITGPDCAKLQLRVNDEPVGKAVDFYSSEVARSGPQRLAELDLIEGKNLLYLTLPGKNPTSKGVGVDLISIKGTRSP